MTIIMHTWSTTLQKTLCSWWGANIYYEVSSLTSSWKLYKLKILHTPFKTFSHYCTEQYIWIVWEHKKLKTFNIQKPYLWCVRGRKTLPRSALALHALPALLSLRDAGSKVFTPLFCSLMVIPVRRAKRHDGQVCWLRGIKRDGFNPCLLGWLWLSIWKSVICASWKTVYGANSENFGQNNIYSFQVLIKYKCIKYKECVASPWSSCSSSIFLLGGLPRRPTMLLKCLFSVCFPCLKAATGQSQCTTCVSCISYTKKKIFAVYLRNEITEPSGLPEETHR